LIEKVLSAVTNRFCVIKNITFILDIHSYAFECAFAFLFF